MGDGTFVRRFPLKPWDTGVSNKIIDRCGPNAAKFLDTEHLKYIPRVPLPEPDVPEETDSKRDSAGGGKKKSSGVGRLMLGDTAFKRWNVPLLPRKPEKEDDPDLYALKNLHFRMQYADTYAELSGSKEFMVEHYDRGVSLFYILWYCISCGILIQRLDKLRSEGGIRFSMNDGFHTLFNGIWWNALTVYAYLMVIQSFGILAKMFGMVQHRIYFMLFGAGIPIMTCAYLWKHNCGYGSSLLLWAAFIIWLVSVGRPNFMNRMADPLADDLFFLCFILMTLQAICAKEDYFLRAVFLLLTAFAYAGPLGYWLVFPARIAIWAGCIYCSTDEVIRALGGKGGALTPKLFFEHMKKDVENVVKFVMSLPVGVVCQMKSCEPGLYGLFAGGPWGWGGGLEDEGEKPWSIFDFGLDIDMSYSADDVFFWLFVLATFLLALYVLHMLERVSARLAYVPEPVPYIKPIRMEPPYRGECPEDQIVM